MPDELNYFNYFSEIEEYFWRKRGAHILVSPLDWAIVETWQRTGIPLPAVLSGIDSAFETYARSKRAAGGRALKSLAYCVDAVADAADRWKEAHAGENPAGPQRAPVAAEPFSRDDLRKFLARTAQKLEAAAATCRAKLPVLADRIAEAAGKVHGLARLLDVPGRLDAEDLERRLTVLEDKLAAALHEHVEDDVMLEVRRELDRSLAPYRRKMKAEQIATLERQFLRKRLFEKYELPRLSLFYLT